MYAASMLLKNPDAAPGGTFWGLSDFWPFPATSHWFVEVRDKACAHMDHNFLSKGIPARFKGLQPLVCTSTELVLLVSDPRPRAVARPLAWRPGRALQS